MTDVNIAKLKEAKAEISKLKRNHKKEIGVLKDQLKTDVEKLKKKCDLEKENLVNANASDMIAADEKYKKLEMVNKEASNLIGLKEESLVKMNQTIEDLGTDLQSANEKFAALENGIPALIEEDRALIAKAPAKESDVDLFCNKLEAYFAQHKLLSTRGARHISRIIIFLTGIKQEFIKAKEKGE